MDFHLQMYLNTVFKYLIRVGIWVENTSKEQIDWISFLRVLLLSKLKKRQYLNI